MRIAISIQASVNGVLNRKEVLMMNLTGSIVALQKELNRLLSDHKKMMGDVMEQDARIKVTTDAIKHLSEANTACIVCMGSGIVEGSLGTLCGVCKGTGRKKEEKKSPFTLHCRTCGESYGEHGHRCKGMSFKSVPTALIKASSINLPNIVDDRVYLCEGCEAVLPLTAKDTHVCPAKLKITCNRCGIEIEDLNHRCFYCPTCGKYFKDRDEQYYHECVVKPPIGER